MHVTDRHHNSYICNHPTKSKRAASLKATGDNGTPESSVLGKPPASSQGAQDMPSGSVLPSCLHVPVQSKHRSHQKHGKAPIATKGWGICIGQVHSLSRAGLMYASISDRISDQPATTRQARDGNAAQYKHSLNTYHKLRWNKGDCTDGRYPPHSLKAVHATHLQVLSKFLQLGSLLGEGLSL